MARGAAGHRPPLPISAAVALATGSSSKASPSLQAGKTSRYLQPAHSVVETAGARLLGALNPQQHGGWLTVKMLGGFADDAGGRLHVGGLCCSAQRRVGTTYPPPHPSPQDHFRKVVTPSFTNVFRDRGSIVGVVEFETRDDLDRAIRKLDDTEFKNPFDRAYIRLVDDSDSRRSRSYSRSRSRSRSRCAPSGGCVGYDVVCHACTQGPAQSFPQPLA